MHVPFVDLHAQYLTIKQDIDHAIHSVIEECAFIKGKYVKEFETQFASTIGMKHCIGVANGTDAIFIALKMLGIGAGDEVITTASSWIATSETISLTGAKPVFVDIDPVHFTIDETNIEAVITDRTKAIIPVHLYGQMAAMDQILAIADKHHLFVVEDCAQSHFSAFNGRLAGTMGIAGTFSFYPGKNLGAYGDAGCIVTNDDKLAENCRMLANHGQIVKHQHRIEGINSRLDGLQAAILSVKLPHLPKWNNLRRQHADRYRDLLKDVEEICIPNIRPNSIHTHHIFGIKTSVRNQLQKYLADNGIETAVHYPTALPFLEAYSYLNSTIADFPFAYAHQEEELSLPLFPEMTEDHIITTVNAIKAFFTSHK